MSESFDIAVAGHLCLDITPAFPADLGRDPGAIFVPGRLLHVGGATISTGGAVSNTGLSLLRMGLRTQLVAKIGSDAFGHMIRELCEAENAAEGLVEVAGEESSYSCCIAPQGIDRIFLHCPGANDTFAADDLPMEIVSRARMFHFGYPSLMEKFFTGDGGELARMFRAVKETGATASLDQSYPDIASPAGRADWRTILSGALPHVDIFLPSLEETLLMLAPEKFRAVKEKAGSGDMAEFVTVADIRALAGDLLAMGAAVAGVKCGARGIYLRTAPEPGFSGFGKALPSDPASWTDRELWVAPVRVPVVSATGSGDAAIAGFLASILHGRTPEASLRNASAAGALAVGQADAVSAMRPFGELESWCGTREEFLPADLSGENGWRAHESHPGLWRGPEDK